MNLDLRSFDMFPAETTLEFEADTLDIESRGVAFTDLMTLKLNIQQIGDEYFCQAFMTVPIEEECCRCLNLFDDELEADFSFSVKTGKGESVLSSESDNSDVIVLKKGEHVADLGQVVYDAVVLALPAKPLCDEDCRGLCPSCGVNLNEESCKCRDEEIDDRWEDLRDLS